MLWKNTILQVSCLHNLRTECVRYCHRVIQVQLISHAKASLEQELGIVVGTNIGVTSDKCNPFRVYTRGLTCVE